ncbi:MAG: 16S rRNA (uracil(1498)-N(3))-methyltransferase [Candidatus Marinimicrobia bacterium]|nr:16S rRNA (uracil(1498)-N(3))-methyltransferase [Candidatus Neomarinimicrobiota bacterium]
MHQFIFYVPSNKITDDIAILEGDEFRHCIQVLRKKAGEEIALFNGQGDIYTARIGGLTKNSCECRITSRKKAERQMPADIILAVGLIKSKALNLIIREASALGVTQFVPLLTKHSVKQGFNSERMRKIAIESVKQSSNFYLPEICQPIELKNWLDSVASVPAKLVAEQENSMSIKSALNRYAGDKKVVLLIGPEGGLHSEEIESAVAKGFIPVNIHSNRLRTELAAIVAVTSIFAHFN